MSDKPSAWPEHVRTFNRHGGIGGLTAEIDALRAENERLLAALTRFGRHELLCSFFKDGPHQASPETICDCGLNAALKA